MGNTQSRIERSNHEEAETDVSAQPPQEKSDDDDFKITVKKLDIVVRPRGVLADG
jgi:hypothetical protein